MPVPHPQKTNYEKYFFFIICAVALFVRVFDLSFQNSGLGGNEPADFFLVLSVLASTVSVIALYILVRQMFGNWIIAAIASFLMATSAWQIALSRLPSLDTLIQLIFLLTLVCLWRAMSTGKLLMYILCGILAALGLYLHPISALSLIIIALTLYTYYLTLKNHSHKLINHTPSKFNENVAVLTIAAGLMIFPKIISSLTASTYLVLPHSTASILDSLRYMQITPWGNAENISLRALSFSLPVLFLACIGLLRVLVKLAAHRKHGHLSTLLVCLLSWLGCVLWVIAFESNGASSSGLMLLPLVAIFAAEALWWLYDFVSRGSDEVHDKSPAASVALVVFLIAIALTEYISFLSK